MSAERERGHEAANLTVEDLLLREEISDVLARYVRGIDRFDLDLVMSCYHPGAFDDHNQFRGTVEDFVAWLGGRLGRHAATTHFVARPAVRRTEPHVAQAETTCMVHQLPQPDPAGNRLLSVAGLRYLDRFEQRDGSWLVAHRRVALDWRYYVPLGPESGQPFEPNWLVGRRDRSDASYFDVGPVGER